MAQNLKNVFQFLKQLKKNNNRDWFANNKSEYESSHEIMIEFADEVLSEMKKHDDIETVSGRKSLHRIYRDVRFSKNKLPYKTNWGGSFRRATNALRGGYYYHLEPGNSFIAGGFWGPNSDDLKHIRKHIAQDDSQLRSVVDAVDTRSFFGDLVGEQVKTAPKGYPKDHPAIDLLRYKQLIFIHSYSDEEVFQEQFYVTMSEGFQQLRPFFDVMSEILTTDLNGVSLI